MFRHSRLGGAVAAAAVAGGVAAEGISGRASVRTVSADTSAGPRSICITRRRNCAASSAVKRKSL